MLVSLSGCAFAQLYPQRQIYRHVPVAQQQIRVPVGAKPVAAQPALTPRNPIQQAAYTTGKAVSQESGWLPITTDQQGQSGTGLYEPWNVNEFPVRSGEGSPYRLVSDSQPTIEKTPPPAGGLQNLLIPTQAAKISAVKPPDVRTQAAASAKRSFPILNIGHDIRSEFIPSNDRKWAQNHAVLQTAEFHDTAVTIRNVRYSRYESAEKYTTQYYDATFNLDDIRTLDLVMVPFQGLTRIAHVESSFGFADGRQIGLSIEARYEEGEKYDPAAAGMRQFELIYVFADERDMVRLATDVNKNDVYIYRLKFEPSEVRVMFVDALQRANKLAVKPEFYHPLTNSCVTNLIAHINKGAPQAVPREYRTLMPGLLDSYMYDLKLVDTSAKTFKETKEMAKVNWLVERYGDLEYFSAGIRQNMY